MNRISIVGAGLVGALLATLLAQRGFSIDVFERRPDPRKHGFVGGRSINLALAERGWHGLRLAGMSDVLRPLAVMMRGRMVHYPDGRTDLLRYGRDDSEVIWSISRGALNIALLDAAEAAGARIEFDHRLDSVEWSRHATDPSILHFRREADGATHAHAAQRVIGADGAGSALREAMRSAVALGERFEPLDHAYKELEIPARAGADRFAMEANALHIWPRGNYMCIALPNAEGSFTVTLFMPNHANAATNTPGFDTIHSGADARALFAREFADALALIPDLEQDFERNPTGLLGTLYLERWRLDSRALLVGDAAHAIVPFHGQGMNCGFEDAVELAQLLDTPDVDFADSFAEFEKRRKPNADAIAAMALENYIEMRDRVDDPDFLLMRALERLLAARHAGRFVPRYWMVTFTRLPYSVAFERGEIQSAILRELTSGKTRLEDVDLARADALIEARLRPLDT